MEKIIRYTLEPYRGPATRYKCPACHKERNFVRYIDTETGSHIDPTVGRCNREDSCGYHKKPRQFLEENPWLHSANNFRPVPLAHPKPAPKRSSITAVPVDVFKRTLANYSSNHFIQFLSSVFPRQIVVGLIEKFFIGTENKPWEGSMVWWMVDASMRIRAGKVMDYNPDTGKRVKDINGDHITWIHKVEDLPGYELSQCFFGEHQLKGSLKPVAIVESEKTAVIASVFYPNYDWLACGQLNGLNATKAAVLAGRRVVLFPDVNGYDKWAAKAKELAGIATFTVSDFLERHATDTDRADGCDLADYLLKFVKSSTLKEKPSTTNTAETIFRSYSFDTWTNEITELENYFSGIEIPNHPIKIDSGTTIMNCSEFIESHLEYLRSNNKKFSMSRIPYKLRLTQLKLYIETVINK